MMGITTTMITPAATGAAGAAGVWPAVRWYRSRRAAPRIHRCPVASDRPEDRQVVLVVRRALWCVFINRKSLSYIRSSRIGVQFEEQEHNAHRNTRFVEFILSYTDLDICPQLIAFLSCS